MMTPPRNDWVEKSKSRWRSLIALLAEILTVSFTVFVLTSKLSDLLPPQKWLPSNDAVISILAGLTGVAAAAGTMMFAYRTRHELRKSKETQLGDEGRTAGDANLEALEEKLNSLQAEFDKTKAAYNNLRRKKRGSRAT